MKKTRSPWVHDFPIEHIQSYFLGFPIAMTVIVFYFWDGQKLETTCHPTISEGSNGVISHEGAENCSLCTSATVCQERRWVSWNTSELYGVVKEL